ncbi:MAG: transketolase family protein [Candidatus Pacebacteria bacterium]|nr:transketolase family protein [Candidatus Paceibacterota bacterium]
MSTKNLKSIREGFGEGLVQAGIENENVVVLSADLRDSTKSDMFAEKFPERFIEVGVAEQNLASVASGMAAMGKIPFATSYAVFSPGRNWEQIRTTITYNDANVKIIGSHGGVVTGADGGSHQALEDIALARVLPRMTVFSPADYEEAKQMTLEAVKIKGPVYIRLARISVPELDKEELSKEGDIVIIATGHLVHQAITASQELRKEGINTKVINLSRIKPLDEKMILSLAKESKGIITVEDHQLAGGMGSAIAEFLSENYPTKIKFIAVRDQYGQSGTPEELLKYYKLDAKAIKNVVYELNTEIKN